MLSKQNPLLVTTRVKVLLTFLVGLVITLLAVFTARMQYIDSLVNRVETISTLVDPSKIESLKARDTSAKQSESYIKRQLQQAHGVNSDAQALYALAATKTNVVYYLVDSEAPGSDEYSPPGKAYENVSEAVKASLYSGEPLIEGPTTDQKGTRLSVIAPVFNNVGEQIAVIGMRIHPSAYYSLLAITATIPVVATLLLMAVFIMTDTIRRHRQASDRMRSELVSIASHEIRTPLTGVRWGEEMLLNEGQPEHERQILQAMYDSTIRLQDSIEDILQLANWQSGRSDKLMVTSANIDHMIRDIIATQNLPAQQKGVSLEFAPSWPKELILNIDAQRMKRVLNNLMSNAIKYSKPNTAVVIGYEHVDKHHVISITDHGIGIPKAEQKKVFDGFYRATNAISYEVGGTGMGLYMSRQAVEQHGGKLWINSKEDEGTTVYVRLP